MPAPNDTRQREVRVFISSTFRDMHAERDHLVTVVFPELRERVEKLGLDFFDVDLRWGVPEKNADGEKANSWEYCRQWIDRVEPFFVCILGQRYGWVPAAKDFKSDEDKLRQESEPRSITDLEVRHAVLDDRKKRRSYFYLRETEAPETATEYVDPPPLSGKLGHLKNEVRSCGRPVRDYPCEWTGSGFTGMDGFGLRVLEDLWSGVLRDERYVSKDVWRQVLGSDPDADPRYTDESQPVPREIWEEIISLAKPEPKEPLDAEREQMTAFATARLRWFQGRTEELEKVMTFICAAEENAPRLAVVAAQPGQGKSALLAKLSTLISEASNVLITHFVGATERSSSAHALVERLIGELDRSGIVWPPDQQEEGQEAKRDFNNLCLRLAERLSDYAGERRIVILVDALNQLTDGRDLQWLPIRLGPDVRVIVSCVEDATAKADGPEQLVLQALAARQPKPLRIPLGPLTESDVRTIVIAYLKEYCHELDREHLDVLCAITQARNPLYLLVMLSELRTLGGNDLNRVVPARIAAMPHDYPDTVSLFRWVLQRLEVFGAEAVQLWCLYLGYGRIGMASHELADLLERKLGTGASAAALRIERGLRRYLQRRGAQLDFFHGQLRQAAFRKYGEEAAEAEVHSQIAPYFRNRADPEGNRSWKGGAPRPFLEVVFHMVGAESADDYCQTLCDLRFVEARCRFGQVFDLIADYRMAQENLPESQEDIKKERARDADVGRWTDEIVAYANYWSDRRDRTTQSTPEPPLPIPPTVCRLWTDEDLRTACERTAMSPTRRDRLDTFADFVSKESYPLLEYGQRVGFVLQHAYNTDPQNIVHATAASYLLDDGEPPSVVRVWPSFVRTTPKTALVKWLNPSPHTRRRHSGEMDQGINAIDYSPTRRLAISASCDRFIRLWDLQSGTQLRAWKGDEEELLTVAMTPDGHRAVTAGVSGVLKVWNLATGLCIRTLEGHTDRIWNVRITPNGRTAISASSDKTVRVWDLERGTCERELKGHTAEVICLDITPSGQVAVSGGADRTIRVWNLVLGSCVKTIDAHTEVIWALKISLDGRRALSGSWDKTARAWDLEIGRCLHTLRGHESFLRSVALSADGSRAVTVSDYPRILVWDCASGICLRKLTGHSEIVSSVCLSPDGRLATTGSWDGTLGLWNLENGQGERSDNAHSEAVWSIATAPSGLHAVTASWDKTLRIWNMQNYSSFRILKGHEDWVNCVSVDPSGRFALSGSNDGKLLQWNLDTGEVIRVMERQTSPVLTVDIAPDGRRAASSGDDGFIFIWDLAKGLPVTAFKAQEGGVGCVRFTPDGETLVWGCDDGLLRSSRIGNKALPVAEEMAVVLGGHAGWVTDVDIASDGIHAVSGARDGSICFWNLEKRLLLRMIRAHGSRVRGVKISPNAKIAISVSWDKTLRVWNLTNGECVALFVASSPLESVAICPIRSTLICGTATGEVVFLRYPLQSAGSSGRADSAPEFGNSEDPEQDPFSDILSRYAADHQLVVVDDRFPIEFRGREVQCTSRIKTFWRNEYERTYSSEPYMDFRQYMGTRDYTVIDEAASDASDLYFAVALRLERGGKRITVVYYAIHEGPRVGWSGSVLLFNEDLCSTAVDRKRSVHEAYSIYLRGKHPQERSRELREQFEEAFRKHLADHELDSEEDYKFARISEGAESTERAGHVTHDGLASVGHPDADPEGMAHRNLEYREALKCWQALPFWKRIRTKKPPLPPGILA